MKTFLLIVIAAIVIYTLAPAQTGTVTTRSRVPPNPRNDTWLYVFVKDDINGGWILLNPNPRHPEVTKPSK